MLHIRRCSTLLLIATLLGCSDDEARGGPSGGVGGDTSLAGQGAGSAGQTAPPAGSGGELAMAGVGSAGSGAIQCGRDATIATAADLEAAAACTMFGTLTIAITDGLSEVSFPALTSAMSINVEPSQSSLEISFPALTQVGVVTNGVGDMPLSLSFPALRTADTLAFRNHGGLSRADLPVLETVGKISLSFVGIEAWSLPQLKSAERIGIDTCSLTTLSLASLTTVSDRFILDSCSALASLEMPLLASVGTDVRIDQTALTSIELPALAQVEGFFSFGLNPALTRVALPLLENADGLGFGDNAMLASVSAPSLVAATHLRVLLNPQLTDLALPALRTVTGDFAITDNPMLPTCVAESLRDQLTAPSATTTISGNAPSGSCP